jgi:hypothetical protein
MTATATMLRSVRGAKRIVLSYRIEVLWQEHERRREQTQQEIATRDSKCIKATRVQSCDHYIKGIFDTLKIRNSCGNTMNMNEHYRMARVATAVTKYQNITFTVV